MTRSTTYCALAGLLAFLMGATVSPASAQEATVGGDLATVSCLRKDSMVTTDGQSVSNEAQITLALVNRSGAWLIDKIQ